MEDLHPCFRKQVTRATVETRPCRSRGTVPFSLRLRQSERLIQKPPTQVDEQSCECSDAAQFQVPHAAVHGVKRETGTLASSQSGAAPATVYE